jgi:hypothetical protein
LKYDDDYTLDVSIFKFLLEVVNVASGLVEPPEAWKVHVVEPNLKYVVLKLNGFVPIEYMFAVPSFMYKVIELTVYGTIQLVVFDEENERDMLAEVREQVVEPD